MKDIANLNHWSQSETPSSTLVLVSLLSLLAIGVVYRVSAIAAHHSDKPIFPLQSLRLG